MREPSEDLAVLRFDGERFANHTLDVDSTQELIAYKKLILECAKELWRRRNPGRVRLPCGFEEGFSLAFSEIREGSAGIPLKRRIERRDSDLPLPHEDEFAEAARLIDDVVDAAGRGTTLPARFPRNVIPLFPRSRENFGARGISSPPRHRTQQGGRLYACRPRSAGELDRARLRPIRKADLGGRRRDRCPGACRGMVGGSS
jgi:hypothetical protein